MRPVCSGAKYANVPTIWVWWVNSGRISASDVADAKPTRHGAPSADITMLAGQMSRCITPRPCMPATAFANARARPIRSLERKRLHRARHAVLAGVGERDRPGIARGIQHLRHAYHPAQPLQHSQLMLELDVARPVPTALCG